MWRALRLLVDQRNSRDLLAAVREDALHSSSYSDTGYIDLLESSPPTRRTLAQRAMTNNRVAAAYERLWRPTVVAALSLHGLSVVEERARAAAALQLDGEQRVLDVAISPRTSAVDRIPSDSGAAPDC
ncbi:hypothetical protein [Rhodococcus koreensis]|uniref:hypothetical protein n=1 Tax=Rhodococcus koreensis TaxID=99653 RepID=UPI0019800464|nr:hypothetical protein [Rhodococcus koreensis]QSE84863.1 hypothetical protein JWS14_40145 [Rhodococcus koreensis]